MKISKINKWLAAGALLLFLLIAGGAYMAINSNRQISDANASVFSSVLTGLASIFTSNMPPSYFKFHIDSRPNVTFIFKLTDPEKIQEARDILAGKPRTQWKIHVMGTIVKTSADYNQLWSYHLDPATIQFFEAAIEVCDASIRYVEEHLKEVGGALLPGNIWCPWGSRLVEEVRLDQPSTVVSRHLFYNNSVFDGKNPLANDNDDSSIAPGKSALNVRSESHLCKLYELFARYQWDYDRYFQSRESQCR